MNSFYRVQSEYLTELTSLILQKNGVIAQEADVTAKSLVAVSYTHLCDSNVNTLYLSAVNTSTPDTSSFQVDSRST